MTPTLAERLGALAAVADADVPAAVHRIVVELLTGADGHGWGAVDARSGSVLDAHVPSWAERVLALGRADATVLERPASGLPAQDGGVLVSCPTVAGAPVILLATTGAPVDCLWLVASGALAVLGRRLLDRAVLRATERIQFGKPIASYQAIRHRLADAATDADAIDLAVGEAAGSFDAGTLLPGETAAVKLLANEAALAIRAAAHQVSGGFGYLEEAGFGPATRAIHVLVSGIGPNGPLRTELRLGLGLAGPIR